MKLRNGTTITLLIVGLLVAAPATAGPVGDTLELI